MSALPTARLRATRTKRALARVRQACAWIGRIGPQASIWVGVLVGFVATIVVIMYLLEHVFGGLATA
jgi:hypothetical protein